LPYPIGVRDLTTVSTPGGWACGRLAHRERDRRAPSCQAPVRDEE